MSNYLAIAAVTATLRQLLLNGLQNSSPGGFSYELNVTLSPPDQARPPSLENHDQINLFLYQAVPNAAWRNEVLPRQVKNGETGFPPLALDLYYLLTAYAPNNDGVEAHRLLGRALSVLHDHAVLGAKELQAALLHSDVHEQVERIRLVPHTLSVEEMSKLWSMFQKPYNISVAWQVSVVLIDSSRSVRAPLPVLTVGSGNSGVSVQSDLEPVTPGLESLAPPARQASVRLGELLKLNGHLLAGEQVRVAITHSRWSDARYLGPSALSARGVSFLLPAGKDAEANLPAGMYTLSLGITRRLGEPEVFTNELTFSLAPSITSIHPASGKLDQSGTLALTVGVSPQVLPGQRVSLLVGNRELKPAAFTKQTATLQFKLVGLGAGTYRPRLRVDGVDSLIVDKTTTPPSFTGPTLEIL